MGIVRRGKLTPVPDDAVVGRKGFLNDSGNAGKLRFPRHLIVPSLIFANVLGIGAQKPAIPVEVQRRTRTHIKVSSDKAKPIG